MIVAQLRGKLPQCCFAEPGVLSSRSDEIDVRDFQCEGSEDPVAIWAPPRATFTAATELPVQDAYEVLVYDEKPRSRLVGAVEIVSPANKDRPSHRSAFVAKCAGYLRERVSVTIVDIVTTRQTNLYAELLDFLGLADPLLGAEPPLLYTTACRMTKRNDQWQLETWLHSLELGQSLPTMPLWLADDLAVPLELEASYEQSCEILNLPASV